jgi:hypothetical protein
MLVVYIIDYTHKLSLDFFETLKYQFKKIKIKGCMEPELQSDFLEVN